MEINELIESKMSSLASPVRDILSDTSNLSLIERLGEAHGLDEISQEMLGEEVALVLIREQSVERFKENLIWNLLMTEKRADSLFKEIDTGIFAPVKKFLIKDVPAPEKTSKISFSESESLNHSDILKEIETPSNSLASTLENTPHGDEKPVSAVTIMPKDAQKLMTQVDTLPTETTHAPELQDAVAQIMPHVGGFKPLDNPLKPTEKVVGVMENKLTSVTKTPIKEMYIPKKPDPYREPIA